MSGKLLFVSFLLFIAAFCEISWGESDRSTGRQGEKPIEIPSAHEYLAQKQAAEYAKLKTNTHTEEQAKVKADPFGNEGIWIGNNFYYRSGSKFVKPFLAKVADKDGEMIGAGGVPLIYHKGETIFHPVAGQGGYISVAPDISKLPISENPYLVWNPDQVCLEPHERVVISKLNALRIKEGLAPVKVSQQLMDIARSVSAKTANLGDNSIPPVTHFLNEELNQKRNESQDSSLGLKSFVYRNGNDPKLDWPLMYDFSGLIPSTMLYADQDSESLGIGGFKCNQNAPCWTVIVSKDDPKASQKEKKLCPESPVKRDPLLEGEKIDAAKLEKMTLYDFWELAHKEVNADKKRRGALPNLEREVKYFDKGHTKNLPEAFDPISARALIKQSKDITTKRLEPIKNELVKRLAQLTEAPPHDGNQFLNYSEQDTISDLNKKKAEKEKENLELQKQIDELMGLLERTTGDTRTFTNPIFEKRDKQKVNTGELATMEKDRLELVKGAAKRAEESWLNQNRRAINEALKSVNQQLAIDSPVSLHNEAAN